MGDRMNRDSSIIAQCILKTIVPHFPPAEWTSRGDQALQLYRQLERFLSESASDADSSLSGMSSQGGSTTHPGGAPGAFVVRQTQRNGKNSGQRILLVGDHPGFKGGEAWVGFLDWQNQAGAHKRVQPGETVTCDIEVDGNWLNGTNLVVGG